MSVDERQEKSLIQELFAYGNDCWRIPVGHFLRGDCLDVYAGTGRRAALLAQQCDNVMAVDPSQSRLAVLKHRSDLPTDTVRSVHGRLDDVPFRSGSFETVVVDCSRLRAVDERLEDTLVAVDRLLADDGTAVVLTEGPVGSARSLPSDIGRLRSVAGGSPDEFGAIGNLERTAFYGLYPSSRAPDYVIDPTDSDALAWFHKNELTATTTLETVGKYALSGLQRAHLLKYALPGYAFVVSRRTHVPSGTIDGGLVLRGRYRSTVLNVDGSNLETLQKVPNCHHHQQFNDTEADTLAFLANTDTPVKSSLPSGQTEDSPFGHVRTERPVRGTQLRNRLKESVESFRWALQSGLEWLAQFQSAFQTDAKEIAPAVAARSLGNEVADQLVEPPNNSIRTFQTPVHGDFNQVNVFVDDDGVSGVIDWEFASHTGSAFVDPTNFLLTLAINTFGDFDRALSTVFLEETPYSQTVWERLERYCDAVGLQPSGVLYHLPAGLEYRMAVNRQQPTSLSLQTIPETWEPWLKTLCRRLPEIVDQYERSTATR